MQNRDDALSCLHILELPVYMIICGALHDLVLCAQFKNVKNAHGGVLLLVKLQVSAYN